MHSPLGREVREEITRPARDDALTAIDGHAQADIVEVQPARPVDHGLPVHGPLLNQCVLHGVEMAGDRLSCCRDRVGRLVVGGALQRGFREATKDWVFYTDGDGQFDFKELPRLLPLLETHDIVSCYRLDRKDPLLRKLNAWCWSRLVNLLFGFGLRDVDCAFKIFPRALFDEITMKSTGALIDTEILAKAHYLGYRIAQLGVHHYLRTAGEQSGANIRVIARAFKELFKLRGEIRKKARG